MAIAVAITILFFFRATSQLLKLRLQLLRWSHLHFICISTVHNSFHSVLYSFPGLMNSISWPVSSVWVFTAQLVEHCSANAQARVRIPLKPRNVFFSATSQLLYYNNNCVMITSSFYLYFTVPIISILIKQLLRRYAHLLLSQCKASASNTADTGKCQGKPTRKFRETD